MCTVDSLLTDTLFTRYSLISDRILDFPSWFAVKLRVYPILDARYLFRGKKQGKTDRYITILGNIVLYNHYCCGLSMEFHQFFLLQSLIWSLSILKTCLDGPTGECLSTHHAARWHRQYVPYSRRRQCPRRLSLRLVFTTPSIDSDVHHQPQPRQCHHQQ